MGLLRLSGRFRNAFFIFIFYNLIRRENSVDSSCIRFLILIFQYWICSHFRSLISFYVKKNSEDREPFTSKKKKNWILEQENEREEAKIPKMPKSSTKKCYALLSEAESREMVPTVSNPALLRSQKGIRLFFESSALMFFRLFGSDTASFFWEPAPGSKNSWFPCSQSLDSGHFRELEETLSICL